MTNSMDDATEEAFEEAGLLDSETKARFLAEKTATLAMIDRLEAKYASRGLKFTQSFAGAVPVQAFGHLDGLRFYFRFRSNWGTLRLGSYDKEFEKLYAFRLNEDRLARIEEDRARSIAANSFVDFVVDWFDQKEIKPAKNDAYYYPHNTIKTSSIQGSDPEDHYNGYLTNEEAYEMFSILANTLEDVPEEEQIDPFTKIWVYEGRAAANTYQEQWMVDHKDELDAITAKRLASQKEQEVKLNKEK